MASSSQPMDVSSGEQLSEDQMTAYESARKMYNKNNISEEEYRQAVSDAISEDFDLMEWGQTYWDPYSNQ